ncbi:MAG: DNA polymerase I [Candidatus Dactylopiibacterium carminicum]|uniref:DNA polymerase I n=1 Tax=Candidatus Dactylopiibacterium carminicum TaxID=857335 RepID=A0A272EWE6_9RHOO|nr:DNA polymerase I [Candidatus Dactylopiibacterium carminicum]KAF7599986.1 DNA polymerase I [Candidatus Dactylopiibacterium carminicum]PAS94432.1 MAG: DNA polymerase I [Candidatus Dactylopiibacterium carminicum]PAS99989.1 MAG: DNA polymerase I [Candidatus Dactylopiibacterium carminicum]
MSKLLLVDGSSYLFRAFHAMPDLRNKAGEPTGALRGVLNMLAPLKASTGATHAVCVFDAKGKTFRADWYPEYKAHRPPMPEDLAAQIEPIHTCVKAMGWPVIVEAGVEADDVIGTLARQAAARGFEVLISTGDKDMAQLVQPGITLINTMTNETLDREGVIAKFGVPPERIVDYLTLVGDAVDNVPGVEKCGPKTAVKWLTEYDSLDAIVANAASIKGVVGENLRRALDFLPLGRRLVTIVCDVPLAESLDELTWRTPDNAVLAEQFARWEFRSLLKAVQGNADSTTDAPAASAASAAGQSGLFGAEELPVPVERSAAHREAYECLLTWEAFDQWFAKINAAALTAFDTETDSLDPFDARLVGMSFSVTPGEAAYLPLAHRAPGTPDQLPLDEVLARLRPWLEDAGKPKLGQNLKYDMHVLANHGIRLRGVQDDTLLESAAWESDRNHDLDSLASRHTDLATLSYTDICGKGAKAISFADVALENATAYGAEDADVTLRVHHKLSPLIAAEPGLRRVYRDIELPVQEVLWAMERQGVLIDADLLARQSDELGRKLLELEQQAYEAAGQPFNLNSPKQLGEILFERQKLPVVKKTPGGAPSTDEEVLAQLALDYPLPRLLLEYRGFAKLKNTYTDKLPRMVNAQTGRVHTSFSQTGAITGRLASSDPNLQNIPVRTPEGRRIRQAFIAPAGYSIVSADYSQIELRIMAHLSGDERLLQAFAQGEDVHRATAAEVFGIATAEVTSEQRRYAKTINFGLIYGMSAHGLAKSLEIERSAAQSWIDRYFARYPGVARYMEETRALARNKGYVETVFGRRLILPEIKSSNAGRRQGAERAAINAPMQGTAADLVKMAMRRVYDWLGTERLESRLLLQVHDELILEVPAAELDIVRQKLPQLMAGVAELKVPLLAEVGVGANWDEAH